MATITNKQELELINRLNYDPKSIITYAVIDLNNRVTNQDVNKCECSLQGIFRHDKTHKTTKKMIQIERHTKFISRLKEKGKIKEVKKDLQQMVKKS